MFLYKYTCHFNDCDPAGIMFYGNLFTVIHHCYEVWLQSEDLGNEVFFNETFAFPIIHTAADYKTPIRLHQQINVSLTVKNIGTSSFTLVFSLHSSENTLHALAETVHVSINKQTGQKTGLPAFVLQVLEKMH